MKRKSEIVFIAVCGLILTVLVSSFPVLAVSSAEKTNPGVVEGNSAFALDLYGELKGAKGNLFFSPYSISTALAMTYAGARENTATQMEEVLHFTLPPKDLHQGFARLDNRLNGIQEEGDIRLHVANSLWPQKEFPFLKEYLDLVKEYYGVTITPLDYARAAEEARKIINQWVEEKTMEKIKNLIQPGVLDALTRLVLVNAIYFKGNWAIQFDPGKTKEDNFYLLTGNPLRAPLMSLEKEFNYSESESLQVLELPYAGDALSMIVLLPREKDGITGLEKHLTLGNLQRWTSAFHKQKVKVFLPKFKMTSQFRLGDTLKRMGMADAFDMNKADFSGMDGRIHWLYIGAVIHKAFVDVNEEGTEAAAATAVVMRITMAAPGHTPIFRADHPFIFFIRENTTGSILFLGRVMDPTQKGE